MTDPVAFKNEEIELFDIPIQNRMKAVNEFKAKKKMMDSSEIEVIKIKDEVTEFCEVQIKTKIKSGNEVKIKKKMMKMNEIFEFQNGIELIDQLDIPVNNEIQDDSNLPDIGHAHDMFSQFLNLRITNGILLCTKIVLTYCEKLF